MILHQLVHGYDSGHRQLAGSIQLESKASRIVLQMSDASGPNLRVAESGYVTGYNLPGTPFYALARTWPATELDRSGCVWTHTLLVDDSNIDLLGTAEQIEQLFVRPILPIPSDAYSLPLNLERSTLGSESAGNESASIAADILLALYEHSNAKVILYGPPKFNVERWFLRIWCQQWPGLRKNFRFCSYAAEDRSPLVDTFDLQMMARKGPSAIKWTDTEIGLQDSVSPERNRLPSWLEDAVQDLAMPVGGEFRARLRQLGGMDFKCRRMYPVLATFARSNHESSPQIELNDALMHLQTAESMTTDEGLARLMPRIAEALNSLDGLEALTASARTFLHKHMKSLWTLLSPVLVRALYMEMSADDLSALVRHALRNNESRDERLDLLLCQIEWTVLRAILIEDPTIVTSCGMQLPALYTRHEVWSDDFLSQKFLDVFESSKTFPRDAFREIVRSGAVALAPRLLNAFGVVVVQHIVEFLDDEGSLERSDLLRPWLKHLQGHEKSVADSLGLVHVKTMRTLANLAEHLDHAHIQDRSDKDCWISALSEVKKDSIGNFPSFACFLCARALSKASPDPAALVSVSLDVVCNTYDAGWIPALQRIARYLPPSLYFWGEASKTKLFRAILFLAMDTSFGGDRILRLTESNDLFRALILQSRHVVGGQDFLRRVLDTISDDDRRLFSRRMAILEQYALVA